MLFKILIDSSFWLCVVWCGGAALVKDLSEKESTKEAAVLSELNKAIQSTDMSLSF
jgi:hypothetical protein